jgi:hypothetical protein
VSYTWASPCTGCVIYLVSPWTVCVIGLPGLFLSYTSVGPGLVVSDTLSHPGPFVSLVSLDCLCHILGLILNWLCHLSPCTVCVIGLPGLFVSYTWSRPGLVVAWSPWTVNTWFHPGLVVSYTLSHPGLVVALSLTSEPHRLVSLDWLCHIFSFPWTGCVIGLPGPFVSYNSSPWTGYMLNFDLPGLVVSYTWFRPGLVVSYTLSHPGLVVALSLTSKPHRLVSLDWLCHNFRFPRLVVPLVSLDCLRPILGLPGLVICHNFGLPGLVASYTWSRPGLVLPWTGCGIKSTG